MKKYLLAAALAGAFCSPAFAQTACTTDASGNEICDPTSFHVTGPGATGTDPVVLHNSNTFTITDVNNGQTIDQPLTIFFATVTGQPGPIVTSYSFDGGASVPFAGTLSNEGTWTPTASGTSKDLYSFVGCGGCDGSLNTSNVDAIENTLGFGSSPTFQINNLVLPVGFSGNTDFVTVNGMFSLGTIIAPLAMNVETVNGHTRTTFFDTSWTNAGVIGTTTNVPEPSTWLMGLAGFGFLAAMAWKRKRAPRLAVEI